MYGLLWTWQICFLTGLTHVPRLASTLNVPEGEGIYQPDTSPSQNISSLLVNNVAEDNNGTSALDVLTPNTTSATYDTLPTLLTSTIQCDGGRYGVNLDIQSCRDALSKINLNDWIPKSTAQRGFGKRPHIILPNRWSSCKAILSSPARWSQVYGSRADKIEKPTVDALSISSQ